MLQTSKLKICCFCGTKQTCTTMIKRIFEEVPAEKLNIFRKVGVCPISDVQFIIYINYVLTRT